jgi:hypothetical protein
LTGVLGLQAVTDKILDAGAEPGLLTGNLFAQFMRDDMARFGVAAKAADLKIE